MTTTESVAGGPTPPQDASAHEYASWVNQDIKYSADFEDSLIHAVLDPDAKHEGIRVVAEGSDEQAVDGVSIRIDEVPTQSLPIITSEDDLPLPLSDPRRKFSSAVPGVKLTHPLGYLEGGPGLDPAMDTFPDDFLSNNPHINTPAQLQTALRREIERNTELLKERMRARQKAKEKNEEIEKKLRMLTDQHSMELKVHERMQEDARKKKEAREQRRREKEGRG